MRKWHVTKFDAYRDDEGEYKIKLDGRKPAGSVGLSRDATDGQIMDALAQNGFAVEGALGGEWIDWLSSSAFNVMRMDRPLYQVTKSHRYSWEPTARRTHAAKYGHVRPGSRKRRG